MPTLLAHIDPAHPHTHPHPHEVGGSISGPLFLSAVLLTIVLIAVRSAIERARLKVAPTAARELPEPNGLPNDARTPR